MDTSLTEPRARRVYNLWDLKGRKIRSGVVVAINDTTAANERSASPSDKQDS